MIASTIALLAISAIVVVALSFDINSYKNRLEAAASMATGLDFRINGKIGLSILPFGVSVNAINVAGKEGEILSLENLKIGVELMPLLNKQLRVISCELVKPTVTIIKSADEKYALKNYEDKSTEAGKKTPFSIKELRVSDGSLTYLDKKTSEKTELKEVSLEIKDLSIENTAGDIIKNISFMGTIDCKEASRKDFRIEDLKTAVNAVKGIYNFDNLSVGALVYFNKAGEKTEMKEIDSAIKDLSIEDTAGDIIKKISLTGTIDCKKVLQKDYTIDNLKTSVKAVKGIYNFDKLAVGSIVYLDNTGERAELKEINLQLNNLSLEDTADNIINKVSFNGTFDCREIMRKDLVIENIKAAVKAIKGIYGFENLAVGSIVHLGDKADKKTELKEINMEIKDMSVGDTPGDIIKAISFTGGLYCKEVMKKDIKIDNLQSSIKVEKGVIYLTPLTMDIFGGKGSGDATADRSRVNAGYKINLKVSKLDFVRLAESFGAKKVLDGKGDLYASLTMNEKEGRTPLGSVEGTFSLRGDNLLIYMMDLDKVLSSFDATQRFNLVDLGAFFLGGPLGAAALKGSRFGDVYKQSRGGHGIITHLVAQWKIRDGMADATDCALSTHHNRVALKGNLNLVGERYDNVTVALLDEKGCAKFKQSISGPFGSPQVGTVSAVETLGGPVLNLLRKAKGLLQGGNCEVFYNGSVRHP